MSTVDELLDGIGSDPIGLSPEEHIVVGSDRFITVPDSLRRIAVAGDKDVETVTFDCPRYWDDGRLDLSTMEISINFMRSDGGADKYHAYDAAVDEDDPTVMHFSWIISEYAAAVNGSLSFLVCAELTNEDGEKIRHWNSELNRELSVSEGLEVDEIIVANYPSVITQILLRLNSLETSGGGSGSGGVNSGKDGGYYTPVVTENGDGTITISFMPSSEDMPKVDPVTFATGGTGTSVVVGTEKPARACLWFNTSGYVSNPEPVKYTVTYNLTNCESRDGGVNLEVGAGGEFQDEIYAVDGYTLSGVTVLMGGVDVTSSVYADNNVYIKSVTGDIVIMATAKAEGIEEVTKYTVTKNVTNCSVDNQAMSVTEGESYVATVTANSGYTLGTVTVTMGGVDVAVTNGVINITSVTGDIEIVATATVTTYSVTKNLTNCAIDNSTSAVSHGASYNATVTANEGYELKSVTATMGGSAVSATSGVIRIASVTGNIVITATAKVKTYSVTKDLTNCSISNSASTVNHGTSYYATITADSGYKLSGVSVTMGGTPVSVSNGVINIASVTGAIVITATVTAVTMYSLTVTKPSNVQIAVGLKSSYEADSLVYNTVYTTGGANFKVRITENGVDITEKAYHPVTGGGTIDNSDSGNISFYINGDVVITITSV